MSAYAIHCCEKKASGRTLGARPACGSFGSHSPIYHNWFEPAASSSLGILPHGSRKLGRQTIVGHFHSAGGRDGNPSLATNHPLRDCVLKCFAKGLEHSSAPFRYDPIRSVTRRPKSWKPQPTARTAT